MKPELPRFDAAATPKKTFGGLDPRAVQAHMDAVGKAWAELETQVAELEARIAGLEGQIAEHEAERDAIQHAIVQAQKTADDMRKEAERICEILEDQARKRSDEMISAAKEETERIESEHKEALQDLQSDLESKMLLKHKFVDEFRMMLRGYLAELDARYPGGKKPAPAPAEPAPERIGD